MEKALELLHHRYQKIEDRHFDLNSWKKGTIAVLDSILGPDNLMRKQIEGIEFENNSWSLRDTTGDVDSIKKTCADVLDTIIQEIEIFGMAEKIVPDQKDEKYKGVKLITEALNQELSLAQLEELKTLIRQKNVSFMEVVDKFKRYGYEVAPRILASLVLNPKIKKRL